MVVQKQRSFGEGSQGGLSISNKVRRGDIRHAVVVRAKKEEQRKDGSLIRFADNACVLINKNGDPIGSRLTSMFTLTSVAFCLTHLQASSVLSYGRSSGRKSSPWRPCMYKRWNVYQKRCIAAWRWVSKCLEPSHDHSIILLSNPERQSEALVAKSYSREYVVAAEANIIQFLRTVRVVAMYRGQTLTMVVSPPRCWD